MHAYLDMVMVTESSLGTVFGPWSDPAGRDVCFPLELSTAVAFAFHHLSWQIIAAVSVGIHESSWLYGSRAAVAINLQFIENNYWCLERFTFQIETFSSTCSYAHNIVSNWMGHRWTWPLRPHVEALKHNLLQAVIFKKKRQYWASYLHSACLLLTQQQNTWSKKIKLTHVYS